MAFGIGGIGFGVTEALHQADENQQNQIARCEVGNQMRVGLQEHFQEQLDEVESHGVPYYEEFLTAPEAQLRALRRESIKKLKYDINVRFKPEDCEAQIK